jgi:cell wall-associated NlpC family hydrolase
LGLNVEFAEKLPGDLAFFTNQAGKVIHVGIIMENNQIIHAAGQVRVDTFIESGILNESKKEITHTLYAIKRV